MGLQVPDADPTDRRSMDFTPTSLSIRWRATPVSYRTTPAPLYHTQPVASTGLPTPIPFTMTQDYKFEGWMGLDKEAAEGKMVWQEFEPKEWEETDVDIKISHCGICGSDLHTLRSGWVSHVPENPPGG